MMMMTTTHTAPVQAHSTRRALRTVVVAGNEPDDRVLQTVADAGDYDIVVVEPMASAYSTIKRVTPQMVIVCLSFEDPDAFQLMSMLKLDRETARIPIVPCLVETPAADEG